MDSIGYKVLLLCHILSALSFLAGIVVAIVAYETARRRTNVAAMVFK